MLEIKHLLPTHEGIEEVVPNFDRTRSHFWVKKAGFMCCYVYQTCHSNRYILFYREDTLFYSISPDFWHIPRVTMIDRLAGLVVKVATLRVEDPGFECCLCRDFSESIHTSDYKIGIPVVTLPGPGVIGSVLGLVDPVSAYCDWVRWKVWSTTSISEWHSTYYCLCRSCPEIH